MRRQQHAQRIVEDPLPAQFAVSSHQGLSNLFWGDQSASRSTYERYVKPALDWALAAVALVILSPLVIAVAAAVYVKLGAPIIFGQRRIGRGGMVFTVYKFRSMHADRRGEGLSFEGLDRRVTHKSPDDPRLTSFGRLLRKSSLDELPQLVNVLKGDMSLVGPRPELPEVVTRHYEEWQHRRHAVKPGITGLWQISERGNGMMHEYVNVDLHYVDRISFTTDARILLKTIPAALMTNQGS